MKNYASNRVRNVVLLGHSGSGKTTYSEAALYYSGATKRFGKVEDGNTVSDYEAEEIRRKVSINTSVIPVEWQDTKINFLDTPGYFDFAAEVKLAMNVADTGLIMVSAKSGVEVGTEKAWEYCEEMHLPRIIFINQMDDENADFEKTLADLRKNFGKAVAPLQIPFDDENGNFIGFINLIKRDARKKVNGKLEKCEMPEDKKDQVEVLRSMLIEVAAESSEELMEKFRKTRYTRFPVYQDSKDNVVGIVNIKDLLLEDEAENFSIKDHLRKPLYTFEAKKVSELMLEMRKTSNNIAVVLDEYGTTAGLITLEDILEEIVGDIRDEYDADEEKDFVKLGHGVYLVDGAMSLDDVNDRLGLSLYSEDYDSIGGLMIEKLDHIPVQGEVVTVGNIRLSAHRVNGNRIKKVCIQILKTDGKSGKEEGKNSEKQ